MSNKDFWKILKPFLTNKGCQLSDFLPIGKDGELICCEQTLVELINENYIKIAEISSGNRPSSFGYPSDPKYDEFMVKAITSKQSTDPSVEKIKEDFTLEKRFVLPPASRGEINKSIISIKAVKATDPACFPVKFARMPVHIIDSHLTNIINSDISQKHYSENGKTATRLIKIKKP